MVEQSIFQQFQEQELVASKQVKEEQRDGRRMHERQASVALNHTRTREVVLPFIAVVLFTRKQRCLRVA